MVEGTKSDGYLSFPWRIWAFLCALPFAFGTPFPQHLFGLGYLAIGFNLAALIAFLCGPSYPRRGVWGFLAGSFAAHLCLAALHSSHKLPPGNQTHGVVMPLFDSLFLIFGAVLLTPNPIRDHFKDTLQARNDCSSLPGRSKN